MSTATTTPTAPATPEQPQAQPETPLFTQSFNFKIPKNEEGVMEIFSTPGADGKPEVNWKALVYALRAGIKQIANNRVRQKFTEKDDKGMPKFSPVDLFDATPLLLDAPQRNVLSQRDKLEKNLKASNLPEAVIATMLETFDKNVGTGEVAGNTSIETNEARVYASKDGKSLIMKVGAPSSDEEDEE